MILEIDAGNSSLKWRWRGSEASSVRDLAALEMALGDTACPGEALVCNVRGVEFEAEITHWLARKWRLRPRFARVVRARGGVRVQYPEPAGLGADRWLAMLAGYRLARDNCLIVDSGTALTIDALDAGGLHLGGYIMPGLATLRSGLLRSTAIRPPPESETASTALGNNTGAAIRNGALFMLCGAVRLAAERLAGDNGASPALILTGGDAPLLRREIGIDSARVVPELVLDGLALADAGPEA